MITIVDEALEHFSAREALLDLSFGEDRYSKTCERLREGRLPVFAFVATDALGRLVGSVRLWSVADQAGNQSLLLGPLAVSPDLRGQKIGDLLMRHALTQAAVHGHGSVILVGDVSYYGRFGFASGLLNRLVLPGPVDHGRFLGIEFVPSYLNQLEGLVSAAGSFMPVPLICPTDDFRPVSKIAR